ncbi:MAG: hypothetical protein JZD41_01215 [Thermoproteus sp.]|nr:hypothetical protein [Thermoproteus sp.]
MSDADSLMEFYRGLDPSYRVLLSYRFKAKYGRPPEDAIAAGPQAFFDALAEALGPHNAEVFKGMYKEWLRRGRGRRPPED